MFITLKKLHDKVEADAEKEYYCGGQAGGLPPDMAAVSAVLGRPLMTLMAMVSSTSAIQDAATELRKCRLTVLSESGEWCQLIPLQI